MAARAQGAPCLCSHGLRREKDMSKLTLALLVLLYSIPSFVPSCHASKNLALGKTYTVSPLPSYPLSAPSTDRTSLTDGKYTAGYFWTQKTTVGWHPVKAVEILIDLEKVSVIDGISFSTARGIRAGVYYPPHIYAFVGPDTDHLLYVGDIVDTTENNPGEYQGKRFLLEGINAKGRYVLLKIFTPKSNSVFCDEIEVLEGKIDKGITGNLTIEDARTLSEQARWLGMGKEIMDRLAANFMNIIIAQPLAFNLTGNNELNIIKNRSQGDVDLLEASILKFRCAELRSQFRGKELLLETITPWSQITPIYTPSALPIKEISLVMPRFGYDHSSFLVTNLSEDSQKITLFLPKMAAGSPKLNLYEVPFVKSGAMEYVADPLVPVSGPLPLRSGESKMIFITSVGNDTGTWRSVLSITGDKSISQAIPIGMRVLPAELPKETSLNVSNWGYLDFNTIKNHKSLAANDLAVHHTNVLVVPPAYLQGANQVKPVDLSRLEAYIKQHKGITKILLGIGLGDAKQKTVAGEHPFLSESWKANFKKWYVDTERIVAAAGFNPTQLYVYPYDEMTGVQVDDFIKLSIWAKKEMLGIQFYATLSVKEALRALPYLDIAQVHNNDELLRDLHTSRTEIWIYDCSGPAKAMSPYSYYRLMAWKAYLWGYKGIGFWAYADAGWGDNPGTAWDDFDGKNPDYAVIYEGPNNTIISSRRWEAWRMGIEDYELLTMYAKAKGEGVAKALAKSVLDNPQDTTKADAVRRKILMELEKL